MKGVSVDRSTDSSSVKTGGKVIGAVVRICGSSLLIVFSETYDVRSSGKRRFGRVTEGDEKRSEDVKYSSKRMER